MNGYEKRREQKKKEILMAASELFLENGFKATSVEGIAALAKVSPVSVYNFFGTKGNLYSRAIECEFHKAMDLYDEILAGEKSFHEKLLQFIHYKVSSRERISPDFFSPQDLSNPDICAVISDIREKRILPFFRRLVEQGKAEGAIDKTIRMESVMIYINIFSAGLAHSQFTSSMTDNKNLSEDIGKLFLFGFSGKPGSTVASNE